MTSGIFWKLKSGIVKCV
uniref:Uncharacterized protein n=1 Tax=Anguilla anguilla TaxID=7936 RepID=A0A0E9QMW0_ANGAN